MGKMLEEELVKQGSSTLPKNSQMNVLDLERFKANIYFRHQLYQTYHIIR